MKFRDDETMSERQLVQALAASGRSVSLGQLSAWRKGGLLPPLASTGLGQGFGRTYYWREPDILEQAQVVHDGLRRHGRADQVAAGLWLRGFSVPLPQLRRAWQSCVRQRRLTSVRHTAPVPTAAPDFPQLLLQAMLGTAAAIQTNNRSRPALAMLEQAAARLAVAGGRPTQARWFWQAAQVMVGALAASDIVRQASDGEMLRAQRLLRTAVNFIVESCEDETPASVADVLGETLFLFILTMLRSGQDAILEGALARIEAVKSRSYAHPRHEPVHAGA